MAQIQAARIQVEVAVRLAGVFLAVVRPQVPRLRLDMVAMKLVQGEEDLLQQSDSIAVEEVLDTAEVNKEAHLVGCRAERQGECRAERQGECRESEMDTPCLVVWVLEA